VNEPASDYAEAEIAIKAAAINVKIFFIIVEY
jgi:hypothetical protein